MGNLTNHQKQVHMKIMTKCCHLCDRLFSKHDLRAHVKSQHDTNDHDMNNCDDCVRVLNKNHRQVQAAIAASKRKAESKRTHSTSAKTPGIECYEKEVAGKGE